MTFQNMHYDERPMGSPPPVDPECYASRVPLRRPTWKLHSSVGRARAAVSWGGYGETRGGEVWKLVDGEWKLLHSVPNGTSALALPWRTGSSAS
ncbi:hypothetical protein [Lentzea sp. NEAU-D7]|uniref:hypothetical protein n=1 Tax=Lentzea sp. NEAU-D7 TaxID=2994667 RepID=UPI00224AF849|nr:hypothetical protein [Lentzea sp. NEAU-D7]MCX2949969.1 hypothetical protein [Lentzea sp. NEAU-D7]